MHHVLKVGRLNTLFLVILGLIRCSQASEKSLCLETALLCFSLLPFFLFAQLLLLYALFFLSFGFLLGFLFETLSFSLSFLILAHFFLLYLGLNLLLCHWLEFSQTTRLWTFNFLYWLAICSVFHFLLRCFDFIFLFFDWNFLLGLLFLFFLVRSRSRFTFLSCGLFLVFLAFCCFFSIITLVWICGFCGLGRGCCSSLWSFNWSGSINLIVCILAWSASFLCSI